MNAAKFQLPFGHSQTLVPSLNHFPQELLLVKPQINFTGVAVAIWPFIGEKQVGFPGMGGGCPQVPLAEPQVGPAQQFPEQQSLSLVQAPDSGVQLLPPGGGGP